MNFAFGNPALAWGLAAAAIPVAIHLFYRRRPRPTPFPALDFILRARKETQRRLRLKKVLLFVARTALLCAIALALARPRVIRPEDVAAAVPKGPSATAIVLDASASMGYRLGSGTLFDKARSDALDALDALQPDEPATALVCGGPAAPAAPAPSFDRASVRRVLRGAELTWGHADMTSCVAAAVRALQDSASGQALGKRVVVATDMTAAAWRLDAPAPTVQTKAGVVRPEVTLLDAARGAALPNAAVVAVDADPDPAVGPRGYRITASLANHSDKPLHDAVLTLRMGTGKEQKEILRAFVDVPAHGTARKTLSHNFAAGGPVALEVALAPDALAVDDARWLTVTVPREVKALVVDGAPSPVKYRDEAFFVEAALSSPASPVKPTIVDVETLSQKKFSDYDVVFLLNVRSLGQKTDELVQFVKKGGGLFIALGDQVDPDLYDEELQALLPEPLHLVKTAADRTQAGSADKAARFGQIEWGHPALSIFVGPAREGFEGVRTWRYALLKPEAKSSARVIASWDDGAPALVEAKRGQGRVILYTSSADRDWSDWPIRTSFLPAIQRFAAYLTGGLEERRDAPSLVYAPRAVEGDEGQKLVAAVSPEGKDVPLRAAPGGKPTVTPEVPGLWQVRVEDAQGVRLDPRLAFVVTSDARESDTTRVDTSELSAYFGGASHMKLAGGKPREGEGRSVPLWSVLLALGLAAFLAEGALVS